MKRLAIFLLSLPLCAAQHTATTCGVADVQTAINSAANGDTVIVPNGSCTWTSGITTTKLLTIQGASTSGVTITHGAGSAALLAMTLGAASRITIANLRFMPGTGTGVYIELTGTGLAPLMHDCYFNIPNFQLQHAVHWHVTGGVIWNTTFESTNNLSGECGGAMVGSDSGSLVVKSNKPWTDASTMGTLDTNGDQNLYIEDSTFSNVGQIPDVDDNGRVVIRHTSIIGSSGLTHGTTGPYGGRHVEYYDNTFSYPNTNRPMNRWFWGRAGTMVITGNTVAALVGACYGTKDSWTFVVENAKRSDGNHGCCTGWQCYHQPGSGSDGTSGHSNLSAGQTPYDTYQISDPIYIWNNTGTGASNLGLNDGDPDQCQTGYTTANFFQSGRDYFLNAGAKPGWTRYAYPHPLRAGGGGGSSTYSLKHGSAAKAAGPIKVN